MFALRGSNSVAIEWGYGLFLAPVALPVVLKHCKLQYKRDVTFKNPSVFKENNRNVADFLGFYNTKSTFASQASPWQPWGSEARPTPPDVALPAYAAKVTQPRLRCQGYAAKATSPRLHSRGYTDKVTQLR